MMSKKVVLSFINLANVFTNVLPYMYYRVIKSVYNTLNGTVGCRGNVGLKKDSRGREEREYEGEIHVH